MSYSFQSSPASASIALDPPRPIGGIAVRFVRAIHDQHQNLTIIGTGRKIRKDGTPGERPGSIPIDPYVELSPTEFKALLIEYRTALGKVRSILSDQINVVGYIIDKPDVAAERRTGAPVR